MKKKFGLKGTPWSRYISALKDEKPVKVVTKKDK